MKRKAMSAKVKAAILAEYGGRCAECGKPFEPGDLIEYDHIHQLAMGGADDPSNLRPVHVTPCHKGKSAKDAAARGKVRRLTGATPKRAGPKIRSRGFDRTFRKRLDGTVERVICKERNGV